MVTLQSFGEFLEKLKTTQNHTCLAIASLIFLVSWQLQKNDLITSVIVMFAAVPIIYLIYSCLEKILRKSRSFYKRRRYWNNLSKEEKAFLRYYYDNDTKCRYVVAINGTYKDSGIINPLVGLGILYLASNISEYRAEGASWMSAEQYFPININRSAYEYFKNKL